jgi:hypothetical protein
MIESMSLTWLCKTTASPAPRKRPSLAMNAQTLTRSTQLIAPRAGRHAKNSDGAGDFPPSSPADCSLRPGPQR